MEGSLHKEKIILKLGMIADAPPAKIQHYSMLVNK